jgi:hypothetical protein
MSTARVIGLSVLRRVSFDFPIKHHWVKSERLHLSGPSR